MSNEEYIEEMYHNAYKSGSIEKFRKKINKKLSKSESLSLCDVIEDVYNEMKSKNQIKEIGITNY